MAGPDPTPGDSGNGGNGRLVADGQLKDRMIMALIAIIFGGGTTIGYQNAFPEAVRPDPWTGTMAAEAHSHMEDEWRRMFHRHENRIQRSMQETRETVRQLVDSINLHAQAGAHSLADARLTRLERDMEKCEKLHD